MKFPHIRPFQQYLQDAESALYILISKDTSLLSEALEQILKLKKETSIEKFDGANEAAALTSLDSFSLFATSRVILIRNADKFSKPALKKLTAYIKQPNQDVTLILTAEAIHRSSQFYKTAEAEGVMLDVPEQKPWEKERTIQEWFTGYTQQSGYTIEPQALQIMCKQLGSDFSILKNEWSKLCCYVGDRKHIQLKDVLTICHVINMSTVWELGTAIFTGQVATATQIATKLLRNGESLIGLLRMMRSQVQTDFQVCTILRQGGSVTETFPYMRGQILQQHSQQAMQFGLERFKRAMIAIDRTELFAKQQSVDETLLIEKLIAQIT